MYFNSLAYFLYLPAVFLIYYFSLKSFRWLVLLVSSFIFYATFKAPSLIIILLLVTAITYAIGMLIHKYDSHKTKYTLLWSGITANALILVLLKYLPFITHQAIVSIGVSFYVFQAISYLIDIYLEIIPPERHIGYFALYMSFFPKLIQGPIERAGDLLPQLKEPYVFNYDNVRAGMLLFTWGLFKKVVIADRLAVMVNSVYGNVHAYKGFPLVLATYYFALQIYFDFSGYTDMALGTARIFNIRLTNNFDNPYLATSVADFWRRWHISFSRWILDYIFKPLQMALRNMRNQGVAIALLITFLISGIWHGASYGFIIWGLLHGIYLSFSIYYKPIQKRIYKTLRISQHSRIASIWKRLIVFNIICFAWIFFRADHVSDATYIIGNIFDMSNLNIKTNKSFIGLLDYLALGLYWPEFVILTAITFTAIIIETHKSKIDIFRKHFIFRWVIYITLCLVTICLYFKNNAGFLYAKF